MLWNYYFPNDTIPSVMTDEPSYPTFVMIIIISVLQYLNHTIGVTPMLVS
jgi:hypothetical protein